MNTTLNRLILLLLLTFLSLPPEVASSASGEQGKQWVGEKGTHETMASVTARQKREDAKGLKKLKFKKERENPDREDIPQNPDSPSVARWVPSQAIADNVQSLSTPLAPQSLGVNFTGATLADTHAFPPDSMGAIGPSQYIVFVNGRIRSFNKASGLADGVLNVDPDVFFASVMTPIGGSVVDNFTSDPQIRFDRLSGRWFLSIIDVPCADTNCNTTAANRLLLAVSDSGVISEGTVWTFYFFQGDSINFLDYPSLGIDANALYIGGNMFNSAGTSFLGCNAYVVRKTSVLTGGPIVVTKFAVVSSGTGSGPWSPRGVDNYDPSSNEGYFIGPDNASFGTLMLRRVSTPGGTPTISANIAITVSSTSFPIDVDHLGNTGGTAGRLDALDDRLFAAHIRNGRLWTTHNIAVTSAGAATSTNPQRRDAVRWYELNVPAGSGTPTVVQSGTLFDSASTVSSARQFWIPTVGVSGQGHVALGFSTAGTPYRANAGTAGRLATDTLGTLQPFTNYTDTTASYNPTSSVTGARINRWGDYSFVSVDPSDDMTMWTIQEFCDNTNSYGVRVVKLLAPPPATPASCNPSVLTQGVANVNVVLAGTSSSGSGFFEPGTNFPNHILALVNGGSVTVNSLTYSNPTNIQLNITVASNATAGARAITVTNPDNQSTTSATGILTIAPVPNLLRTITANAGGHGSIMPSGSITVTNGDNQSFTITPNACYHINDVLVDSLSVGAVSSYTFTNVTANHTLSASFAIDTFTITASTGTNGAVAPSGAVNVNCGTNQSFTITPASGYHVGDVLVDSLSVGAVTGYTFTNVIANHTLSASFAINTYTVTALAGGNGTISPSGSVTVTNGDNQSFTVAPDSCYHIADVLVDSLSAGAVAGYTFTNVTSDHTISASFALSTYTIIATAATNGTISPIGTITVNCGTNQNFTVTADPGYPIVNVLVDSTPVGPVSSYTFTNIIANHTIDAMFATNLFRILSITLQGQDVQLVWPVVGGHSYNVQATSGEAGGYSNNFVDLGLAIVVPGGGESTTNYLDPVGATNTPARYYRVRLVP